MIYLVAQFLAAGHSFYIVTKLGTHFSYYYIFLLETQGIFQMADRCLVNLILSDGGVVAPVEKVSYLPK